MQSKRIRRQDRVLAVVQENTQQALNHSGGTVLGVNASTISDVLQMDRSNVARELNSLYKDGQLIKLQGKPTLYICRSVLAQQYPNVFFPSTLPKGSQLETYITAAPVQQEASESAQATTLETRVGVYATLRSAILRAKAAVTYPSHDLHTLITGSVGVGKAQFAQAMYQHAVSRGSLASDAPYIVVNCQEYKLSPQLMMNQLFGCARSASATSGKSQRGLIERSAGGILCLNGIDNLSATVQDALITLLEKNTYTRVGDPSVTRYSNAMIIAISTQNPDTDSMAILSQRFPVQIRIPDLKDWSLPELLEILIQTFQKEAASTGLSFRIPRDCLDVFLKGSYTGNLGEISSIVRTTCGLVFLDCNSISPKPKVMEISLQHLPTELLRSIQEDGSKDMQIRKLLDLLQLKYLQITPTGFSTNQHSARIFLDLLHQEPVGNTDDQTGPLAFVSTVQSLTSGYFQSQVIPAKMQLSALRNQVPQEISDAARQALAAFPSLARIPDDPANFFRLASCVYDGVRGALPTLENGQILRLRLKSACPIEWECSQALCANAGGVFSDSDQVYIIMCLRMLHKATVTGAVPILAVLHGQGIAESMADYVNEAVGSDVVTPIGYHPGMSMAALLEHMVSAAKSVSQGQGVLLAVDMDPLTDLHTYLTRATGIPARTISDVNLPLLLSIAQSALRPGNGLLDLRQRDQAPQNTPEPPEGSFLHRTISEVLTPSLTFLNPVKSIDILENVLSSLTSELGILPSRELEIKFIFHCAHMLERLIRGESLRYDGLKLFVNRWNHLMEALEKHMRQAAEIFGVSIPASELAYIAEILLPYLN